jgi:FG-GAP-like repeat/FG-GAP repeat
VKTVLATTLTVVLGFVSGDTASRPPRFHQVSIHTDRGPRCIAVADLNHDGNPDILVANGVAGTVSVLLGDGKGNFQSGPGSPIPAGHLPNDLAVADMNGDGNLDVVIANHQSPYLTILLGDGTGKFAPAPGSPFDVHSNPHPHGVAVADFDGDGKPDVATDSWADNKIELLPGDGKGGLRLPGRFFPVGHRPYERLRSADFNRDGHPDIVTTNLDDGTVSILLGDGKGGFAEAHGSPFAAGAKPWQVFVDDINQDGNADLVILPYQRDIGSTAENGVTVLLGDGHGSFSPMSGTPLPLGECRGPNDVTARDLGNGRIVIAVACAESRELMLFVPDAQRRFTSFQIPAKGGWGGIAIAKLTNDSRREIITADNDDGTITIYFPD